MNHAIDPVLPSRHDTTCAGDWVPAQQSLSSASRPKVAAMSLLGHAWTSDVTIATQNNDLRRRGICSCEVDLLLRNDLRRRETGKGVDVTRKCQNEIVEECCSRFTTAEMPTLTNVTKVPSHLRVLIFAICRAAPYNLGTLACAEWGLGRRKLKRNSHLRSAGRIAFRSGDFAPALSTFPRFTRSCLRCPRDRHPIPLAITPVTGRSIRLA